MPQQTFTPREHEVLRHIAEGETTQIISGNLGIEPRTVECHRLAIRRKARLSGGKTALFQFARRYFGGAENLPKKSGWGGVIH